MIILDTETTGLIGNSALPLEQQPSIIELAAIRVDNETLQEVGRMHFKCKPPILPLDPTITKITGITSEELVNEKPFINYVAALSAFFCGEMSLAAHNLAFDLGMLELEMKRLDRVLKFPWPPLHYCTAELTTDIQGKYSKQDWLYQYYTGRPANQTHRAMDDVLQLLEIVRHMRQEERI